MSAIANRLQRLRASRGLSVSDVARKVGVAESTYREWEYGREIRGEPYARLADIFGVSLSELLVGSDPSGVSRDIEEIEGILKRIKRKL